jgi:hypothetical protein
VHAVDLTNLFGELYQNSYLSKGEAALICHRFIALKR